MTNDTIITRRLAFVRLGLIACAAFTVPSIVAASHALAEGTENETHDSTEASGSDDNSPETENETGSDNDDAAPAVIPPAASSITPANVAPATRRKRKTK
jgi:cytoskeletal protein RodZ